MNKLSITLQQAIKSTHKSNTSKKHEKWFEKLLIKNGFLKKTLGEVGMSKHDVRIRVDKNESTLFFIPEPLGSQNTPDFLVSDEEGNLFYIELKRFSLLNFDKFHVFFIINEKNYLNF